MWGIEHPKVDNTNSSTLFFPRQTRAAQFHKLWSWIDIYWYSRTEPKTLFICLERSVS